MPATASRPQRIRMTGSAANLKRSKHHGVSTVMSRPDGAKHRTAANGNRGGPLTPKMDRDRRRRLRNTIRLRKQVVERCSDRSNSGERDSANSVAGRRKSYVPRGNVATLTTFRASPLDKGRPEPAILQQWPVSRWRSTALCSLSNEVISRVGNKRSGRRSVHWTPPVGAVRGE